MTVISSPLLHNGQMALAYEGRIVYIGRVGDPIEDALCDEIIVSRYDYERIKSGLSQQARDCCP